LNQWYLQWLAPDLVGRIDLELPIRGVGRDESGLAAIAPGAALVADLGPDACNASQPGDPVLENLPPLIAQIVSELAPSGDCRQSPADQWVAIDLATV
jgi:hypothetical protein